MHLLEKCSVSIAGHRTSVALEAEFWAILRQMAHADGVSLPKLIARVDAERGARPLASALRLLALAAVQSRS
ncbi:MAG: ribbon-helix-helix domain-containing protein [Alphaproteobacteria bacterium]|nr:ribbon-helix-helix domain-containing protein [Alphaproteobacteria bacterium]MBV9063184.1 ribbon-helix-helix domain-containing protein [Alphaproteobacteria bacterium]